MHIPDGMLDTKTWVTAWIGSAGILGFAAREVRRRLTDARVVLMAVLAALIFALQMLNFPVAGGTSGHFAGGAAAAIVLGPWPAAIVMASVLGVQAIFFADGGITAFGANALTMGIVSPLVGWIIYRWFTSVSDRRGTRLVGAFAAAWTACTSAALVAAVMLWVSGRADLLPVAGAMGFWHAIIGVGEGVITAGLVGYLHAVRPDLLAENREADTQAVRGPALTLGAVAIAAAALSFLASASPDGLEHVYEHLGRPFGEIALLSSPMPDYVVPGLGNETLAGVLAGIVGVIVTGGLLYALAQALKARRA